MTSDLLSRTAPSLLRSADQTPHTTSCPPQVRVCLLPPPLCCCRLAAAPSSCCCCCCCSSRCRVLSCCCCSSWLVALFSESKQSFLLLPLLQVRRIQVFQRSCREQMLLLLLSSKQLLPLLRQLLSESV